MNRQELEKLKFQLRLGSDWRKTTYSDMMWRQYEDYWDNKYPGKENVLHVPVLVSDASRQKASLIGAEPRVIVRAQAPEQVASARILQAKLNKRIKKVRLKDQLEDLIQDTQTLGTGFILDGYGSQFGVHRMTPLSGFDRTRRNEKYERIEYNSFISEDQPWSLRVHPSSIVIPYNVTRLSDCQGFYHRYVRHIDDVMNDEKYSRKHRIAIKADCSLELPPDLHGGSQSVTMPEEYVTLYDYYDYKRNRRVTFSENYPYALSDSADEIMLRIDRIPLHPLVFNMRSRNFWGTSDFDFQETLAEEINDIRTIQSLTRRQQIIKLFYDKNMLDADTDDIKNVEKAIQNMSSTEIMTMIGINGNPKDFLQQFTPSQSYDFMPQIQLCKDEIQEFGLGIGRTQKGLMEGGRHTAYETKKTEDNSDRAIGPRRNKIVSLIIDIMENWVELIVEFQTETELVKVIDASGRPVVVEFKGADLVGDYEIEVSMDSLRSRSKDEDIEQANMILSQLMPFAQGGIVNPHALVRQYLSRVTDDWDIDSIMMDQSMQPAGPVPFDQYQASFAQAGRQPQGPPNLAGIMNGPMQQMMGAGQPLRPARPGNNPIPGKGEAPLNIKPQQPPQQQQGPQGRSA